MPRDRRAIDGRSPFAGATVVNLSPAVAEELRLPAVREGVVVAEVAPGTAAEMVGFQPGDIVLEVNGEAIDSTRTLARVAASRQSVWRLSVDRGGQVMQLALRG